MYNCPVRWYTVVDEMSVYRRNVCRRSVVDEMSVDELSWNRREIVHQYNRSMGGVDKLDQLISLYRTFIKSRKWTLRMICHGMDLAVVNSWLEYMQDAARSGMHEKDMDDLLEFRLRFADSLVLTNKPAQKRGRPSSLNLCPDMQQCSSAAPRKLV